MPQRDLQTSDLPLHLQQTLPQYRFTTKSPPPAIQYNFQSSPAAFRPPQTYQNIIPSTHRPNYSHLFSQNHNHDPSQTETFLGEITIQNPVEFPPRFGGGTFQPVKQYNANKFTNAQENVNQNLDYYEKSKVNENAIQFGSRQNNILNHRTRIFLHQTIPKNLPKRKLKTISLILMVTFLRVQNRLQLQLKRHLIQHRSHDLI